MRHPKIWQFLVAGGPSAVAGPRHLTTYRLPPVTTSLRPPWPARCRVRLTPPRISAWKLAEKKDANVERSISTRVSRKCSHFVMLGNGRSRNRECVFLYCNREGKCGFSKSLHPIAQYSYINAKKTIMYHVVPSLASTRLYCQRRWPGLLPVNQGKSYLVLREHHIILWPRPASKLSPLKVDKRISNL